MRGGAVRDPVECRRALLPTCRDLLVCPVGAQSGKASGSAGTKRGLLRRLDVAVLMWLAVDRRGPAGQFPGSNG